MAIIVLSLKQWLISSSPNAYGRSFDTIFSFRYVRLQAMPRAVDCLSNLKWQWFWSSRFPQRHAFRLLQLLSNPAVNPNTFEYQHHRRPAISWAFLLILIIRELAVIWKMLGTFRVHGSHFGVSVRLIFGGAPRLSENWSKWASEWIHNEFKTGHCGTPYNPNLRTSESIPDSDIWH